MFIRHFCETYILLASTKNKCSKCTKKYQQQFQDCTQSFKPRTKFDENRLRNFASGIVIYFVWDPVGPKKIKKIVKKGSH